MDAEVANESSAAAGDDAKEEGPPTMTKVEKKEEEEESPWPRLAVEPPPFEPGVPKRTHEAAAEVASQQEPKAEAEKLSEEDAAALAEARALLKGPHSVASQKAIDALSEVELEELHAKARALIWDDPVWEALQKKVDASEAANAAEAARYCLRDAELRTLLAAFAAPTTTNTSGSEDDATGPGSRDASDKEEAASRREAAGLKIRDEWTCLEAGCARVAALNGPETCAGVVRHAERTSPRARLYAMQILANVASCAASWADVTKSDKVAVAIAGAFCAEVDHPETCLDACWLLCFFAKRSLWGALLAADVVIKRLSSLSFELTCQLDPSQGPRVERTKIEETLTAKCFELAWRIAELEHTTDDGSGRGGFEKLAETTARSSILTAAIEYVLDKRAKSKRTEARHRHDGSKIKGSAPSGLDCALRLLWRLAERDNDALPHTPEDQIHAPLRRMIRVADAARACKAWGNLENNEFISAELAFVQGMWPFHDFEAEREQKERGPPTEDDYREIGPDGQFVMRDDDDDLDDERDEDDDAEKPNRRDRDDKEDADANDDTDDSGQRRSRRATGAYPAGAYAGYLSTSASAERLDLAVPASRGKVGAGDRPTTGRTSPAPASHPSATRKTKKKRTAARPGPPTRSASDDAVPGFAPGFAPGFLAGGSNKGKKKDAPPKQTRGAARTPRPGSPPTAMDVDG